MFGYVESRVLRRRGGPVPVKEILPAVLADLHEVCIAGATNGSFDPAIADLPKAQSEAAPTLLEAA
jgi:hypothetical protein